MDKEELKQKIIDDLKPRLEQHYLNGVKVGWKAAYSAMYKDISSMTSSKKIKEYLKAEYEKITCGAECSMDCRWRSIVCKLVVASVRFDCRFGIVGHQC